MISEFLLFKSTSSHCLFNIITLISPVRFMKNSNEVIKKTLLISPSLHKG